MTEKVSAQQAEDDSRNENVMLRLNGRVVPKAKALVSV